MDSSRKAALSAGVLFISATAASIAGAALYGPIANDPDRLTQVGANGDLLAAGALLQLAAAGASVGIAIALYPVLRRWGRGMALGSVVFRTIEAAMYTVGAVSLLSLLPLGQRLASTSGAERASFAAIGDALMGVRDAAGVAGVLAFVVGALLYYWLLYRSNLVPRWLSGWGIAALLPMTAACLLAVFEQHPVTSYVILALPIAIQEIVFALWLIARGFSPAVTRTVASATHVATHGERARALIQGGHV